MNGKSNISKSSAIFLAISAAALYAINIPFSKQLLKQSMPTMLAGLLYIGAGIGIGIMMLVGKLAGKNPNEHKLEKSDLPYVIAMVALDIAAPIFLMMGIKLASSASVSLLNNFEIVATALIAFFVFKEKISKMLTLGITLIVISSIVLGFDGTSNLTLNIGSLLVVCACICWGIENNCTRKISHKSSDEIVLIKGIFSGLGSIFVALFVGEHFPKITTVLLAMLLGFVAYGLSIKFYVMAQYHLGAAKTSAFYSVAPFLGVGFSFLLLGEKPLMQFYIALVIMMISTVIIIKDTFNQDKLEKARS